MIDNHVLRLDVAVHDAHRVRVVQPLQNLVDVELAVPRLDGVEDGLVVGLLDVLEDQAVDLALLDDVEQFDAVVPSPQRHEDLYLPIDLLELYYISAAVLGFSIFITHL